MRRAGQWLLLAIKFECNISQILFLCDTQHYDYRPNETLLPTPVFNKVQPTTRSHSDIVDIGSLNFRHQYNSYDDQQSAASVSPSSFSTSSSSLSAAERDNPLDLSVRTQTGSRDMDAAAQLLPRYSPDVSTVMSPLTSTRMPRDEPQSDTPPQSSANLPSGPLAMQVDFQAFVWLIYLFIYLLVYGYVFMYVCISMYRPIFM